MSLIASHDMFKWNIKPAALWTVTKQCCVADPTTFVAEHAYKPPWRRLVAVIVKVLPPSATSAPSGIAGPLCPQQICVRETRSLGVAETWPLTQLSSINQCFQYSSILTSVKFTIINNKQHCRTWWSEEGPIRRKSFRTSVREKNSVRTPMQECWSMGVCFSGKPY